MSNVITSAQRVRWFAVGALGVVLSIAVGGSAALFADDHRGLTFVVYAVVCAPVLVAGAAMLLPDRSRPDPVTHAEDTVEYVWAREAGFGSFCDLLTVLGLAVAVESIADVEPVPILVFLVLGMVSFALRVRMASRRAA